MRRFSNALLFLMFASSFAMAQSKPDQLTEFLRGYLGPPDQSLEQEGASRYSRSFVDLKDDGSKEIIVYLTGRMWCGSGGCQMLILALDGTSYRVVTNTTITRLPIRVLDTKSNGWHDISVFVAGGGIRPGYESELYFDGSTYPSNPSVPPARPVADKVRGKIVVPVMRKDMPLYR